ncbi:MAG: restriction endonuclease subunit S [Rhizobiales bacterium]|nr:restriction endonuclease subunit S [Hyphomicrobiales bacterium]
MTWPIIPIRSFCNTGSGTTPARDKSERYYGGSIPWVKSGELREAIITKTEEMVTEAAINETALRLVPSGALLVAMYGATVGRVGILGVPATTNQAVCHIVPDPKKADQRYLFHALRALAPELVKRGVGGAQPNINQQIVKDAEVPLPPVSEQRRIAAILDQVDGLRCKRREAVAMFHNLRQSAFKELFGDPASNPRGWPVGRILDVTSSTQYGTSAKAGEEGRFPILRMGNLTTDGGWKLDELKYIDLVEQDIAKYTVRKGDILFNRTNSPDLVGKSAVFREEREFAFAGYLVRLRLNGRAEPEFVSAYLNSTHGKATLRGMCKSIIGMANINAKELTSIPLMIPPIELQKRYASMIEKSLEAEILNTVHLRDLDQLFNSLQHRAFRGEL